MVIWKRNSKSSSSSHSSGSAQSEKRVLGDDGTYTTYTDCVQKANPVDHDEPLSHEEEVALHHASANPHLSTSYPMHSRYNNNRASCGSNAIPATGGGLSIESILSSQAATTGGSSAATSRNNSQSGSSKSRFRRSLRRLSSMVLLDDESELKAEDISSSKSHSLSSSDDKLASKDTTPSMSRRDSILATGASRSGSFKSISEPCANCHSESVTEPNASLVSIEEPRQKETEAQTQKQAQAQTNDDHNLKPACKHGHIQEPNTCDHCVDNQTVVSQTSLRLNNSGLSGNGGGLNKSQMIDTTNVHSPLATSSTISTRDASVSPIHGAAVFDSPNMSSPASSLIFERSVQDFYPNDEKIPTHYHDEDCIPPVLDASTSALLDNSVDRDLVDVISLRRNSMMRTRSLTGSSVLSYGLDSELSVSPTRKNTSYNASISTNNNYSNDNNNDNNDDTSNNGVGDSLAGNNLCSATISISNANNNNNNNNNNSNNSNSSNSSNNNNGSVKGLGMGMTSSSYSASTSPHMNPTLWIPIHHNDRKVLSFYSYADIVNTEQANSNGGTGSPTSRCGRNTAFSTPASESHSPVRESKLLRNQRSLPNFDAKNSFTNYQDNCVIESPLEESELNSDVVKVTSLGDTLRGKDLVSN